MSLRDEQKRLTRQRLVAASYEVFAKSGYIDTSIQDITDAADVNRATFYQHFTGKPDIFAAAIEHQLAISAMDHWETLDGALITGTRASIRAWLEDASHWWIANAPFVAAWEQAIAVDSIPGATRTAVYDRIGNSLAQYQMTLPEGAERKRHVLVVEMLILQLSSALTGYLEPNPPRDKLADVLDALTEIWCASLHITTNSA